jgi:RNA recognition motif-containing protein
MFGKHGRIKDCTIKQKFGFVEYEDERDADDAIKSLDGTSLDGEIISVEKAHGGRGRRDRDRDRDGHRDRDRDRGDRDRGYRDRGDRDRGDRDRGDRDRRRKSFSKYTPPRNTDYRVIVEDIPRNCNWKDIKDHFRECGNVCFADVRKDKGGKEFGIVEFKHYEDMKRALRDLNRTKIRGSTIQLVDDYNRSRRSSSKSRDSRSKSPRRSGSKSPRDKKKSPRRSSSNGKRDSPGKRESPRTKRSPSPSPNRNNENRANSRDQDQDNKMDDVRSPRSPNRKQPSMDRHRSPSPSPGNHSI